MRIPLLLLALPVAFGCVAVAGPSATWVLALALLWIWPGYATATLLSPGASSSPLRLLANSMVAGAALHGIAATVLGAAHAPLGSAVGLVVAVPTLIFALRRAPRPRIDVTGEGFVFAACTLGLAVVVLAVSLFRLPTIDLRSDVLAHVAAIRACIAESAIFPTHEFHRIADAVGIDPRFGTLHALYANLARFAGREPVDLWSLQVVFARVVWIVGCARLIEATVRGVLPRLAALLAFCFVFGGATYNPLETAAYPLWIGLALVFVAVADEIERPSGTGWRRTLWIAALLGGAGALHALAFILGAMALALLWLLRLTEGDRDSIRTAVSVFALSTTVMVIRFALAYSNANPIHQKAWQVLQWSPGWYGANPLYVIGWLTPLGVLVLVAFLPRSLRRSATTVERWVAALAVVSLAWMSIPWLLTPTMALLGFLPLRFVMLVFTPLMLGHGLRRLQGRVRWSVATALLLLLALQSSGRLVALIRSSDADLLGSPSWQRLVHVAREELGPEDVVLSDPFTMLALKASAPPAIVSVPDGRSSPADARAIERLRDSWRMMSPTVGGERTRDLIERYGVTHVLLNHVFEHDVDGYEYTLDVESFAAQRAKFGADRVRAIFAAADADLLLLPVDAIAFPDEAVAAPCTEPLDETATASVVLRGGFRFAPGAIRVSDDGKGLHLDGYLSYEGTSATAPDRNLVVRLDAPNPAPNALRWIEKPVRKLRERIEGRRYRQRWTLWPRGGACPTFVLEPGTRVRVSADLRLSPLVGSLPHRLGLQVSDVNAFEPKGLRDLLRDDDYLAGPPIATLQRDAEGRVRVVEAPNRAESPMQDSGATGESEAP